MSKLFFVADTHFGHERIIKFCNRPYTDVVDMDIDLINRWNRTVAPNDVVYHLGDFSFYRDKAINEALLEQLAGEKHLIVGNHDHDSVVNAKGWASVQNYLELTYSGKRMVLFHYPMVDWNGRFYQSWHLYGHVHNRYHQPQGEFSMDVGADAHDLAPVSFDNIRARLENGWQEQSGWFR